MERYYIEISETRFKNVSLDAQSLDDAMTKVDELYCDGFFVFDYDDNQVTTKKDVTDILTEFEKDDSKNLD